MNLTNFVKEQTSLNDIAEILKVFYKDDEVLNTQDNFDKFVETTYELLLATEESTHKLIKDTKLLKTIIGSGTDNTKEAIDDIIYMTLHATIAKQIIIINKLLIANDKGR